MKVRCMRCRNVLCEKYLKEVNAVALWEYDGIAEENTAWIRVIYYCPFCYDIITYEDFLLWGWP